MSPSPFTILGAPLGFAGMYLDEAVLKPVYFSPGSLFRPGSYTGFSPGVNGFSIEVSSGKLDVLQAIH